MKKRKKTNLKAVSPLGFGLINLVLILCTSCAMLCDKVVRSLQLRTRTLIPQKLTRPNQLVFYFSTGFVDEPLFVSIIMRRKRVCALRAQF